MGFTYLATPAGTGDVQLMTGRARVTGWSARETVGAPAEFVLRDGTSSGDPGIVHVQLGPKESAIVGITSVDKFKRHTDLQGGLEISTGIFVDRVSGATELAVYIA